MNSPKQGTTWRQKRAARFAAGIAVAAITAAGIGIAAGGAGAATGWSSRMTVAPTTTKSAAAQAPGPKLVPTATGWGGCC
jgi:hypothetical protein